MIVIDKISKHFGSITAVDMISFSVSTGEVLGFLGPNGAGKSTTMKMITGYLPPDHGTIQVCGFDTVDSPLEAKRNIGYLPEGAASYGDMVVQDYLSFIADIRHLKKEKKKRALDSAITNMALEKVLWQKIETLSKGFKRRVALAQAILHDPKVLILDEPTDGLDPNQKYQVRELIRNLSTDKIVIISTHILEEVGAVCSRAMIIAAGKVVADSTPDELARQATQAALPQQHGHDILPALNEVFRTLTAGSMQ